MSIKQLGVPLTLSSIGPNYVFDEWRTNYQILLPYQISGKFRRGNADEVQTPKGLFDTGDVGLHLSNFIGNYKGGRNESFMYGAEVNTYWYDYDDDLVNAYTTAKADLSLPNYRNGRLIDPCKIKNKQKQTKLTTEELLKGYFIVNGTFKFPKDLKYPSISCYVDETTTIYPLEGSCLLTGPEFILTKQQGCVFDIKSVFYIPPTELVCVSKNEKKNNEKNDEIGKNKKDRKIELIQPFQTIIKEMPLLRRENAKGSFKNLLYKEVGNSIYGPGGVVRGYVE